MDLTDMRFGRFTVLGKYLTPEKTGTQYWRCKCDCGTVLAIAQKELTY